MEVGGTPATIIMALVVGLAGWFGHIMARRGQKDQNRLDAAAYNLQVLIERAERAERGEVRERDRAQRAEDELDEQRDEYRRRFADLDAACRAAIAEQTATCRAEVARLSDALQLMKTVVHNEVASAVAVQAIEAAQSHTHVDDPVTQWLDGPPDLD